MKMFVDVGAIYLHRDAVDFRKSINGLVVIVEQEMQLSPFTPALFVFCNKNRDRMKVLYWDETGFCLAQQRRFGQSSETNRDQLNLFNESEQTLEEAADEKEHESIRYTRKKPSRKPLPDYLPRETVIHDIADADKICGDCGHELHRMGEDTSEQLEFIPASIKVIEHVRPKYSCRQCEQHGTDVVIKIAPVPPTRFPRVSRPPRYSARSLPANTSMPCHFTGRNKCSDNTALN